MEKYNFKDLGVSDLNLLQMKYSIFRLALLIQALILKKLLQITTNYDKSRQTFYAKLRPCT